jgi:hypothetical protein
VTDTIVAEHILKLLDYDPGQSSRDLQSCLKIGDTMDDQGLSRAPAMIQSYQLNEFLAEDTISSALLVNGNDDLEAAEGESPLSFFDAKLAEIIQENGQAFSVKHFSSLHREVDNYSGIPSTTKIITSIVGDLLTQMLERKIDVDVLFLTTQDREKIENSELDIMCNVFRELILQLPPKTILFCILDEVSSYETAKLGTYMNTIIRRLTRLVKRNKEVIFKLLVTCRGRSLCLQKYFDDEEILDLPEDVELDEAGTWKLRNLHGTL